MELFKFSVPCADIAWRNSILDLLPDMCRDVVITYAGINRQADAVIDADCYLLRTEVPEPEVMASETRFFQNAGLAVHWLFKMEGFFARNSIVAPLSGGQIACPEALPKALHGFSSVSNQQCHVDFVVHAKRYGVHNVAADGSGATVCRAISAALEADYRLRQPDFTRLNSAFINERSKESLLQPLYVHKGKVLSCPRVLGPVDWERCRNCEYLHAGQMGCGYLCEDLEHVVWAVGDQENRLVRVVMMVDGDPKDQYFYRQPVVGRTIYDILRMARQNGCEGAVAVRSMSSDELWLVDVSLLDTVTDFNFIEGLKWENFGWRYVDYPIDASALPVWLEEYTT